MNKRLYVVTYILVILTGLTAVIFWLQSIFALRAAYEGSYITAYLILSKIDPKGVIDVQIFADVIYLIGHSLKYAILGMELTLLRVLIQEPRLLTNGLIVLSVSVIDESIQWILDPTNSVLHVGLNFTGALIGLAFIKFVYVMNRRIDRILSDQPSKDSKKIKTSHSR